LLIKHGADINAANKNGLNMLHVSAQGEAPVSMAYFLEKGLKLDSRDVSGRSPLHHAASIGNGLWIGYAVAQGAKVDAVDSEGKTPLITSCKTFMDHRNVECLKKLISAEADPEARDTYNKRGIDYLQEYYRPDVRDDQLKESLNVVNE
jgi:ankyrin repeat protein